MKRFMKNNKIIIWVILLLLVVSGGYFFIFSRNADHSMQGRGHNIEDMNNDNSVVQSHRGYEMKLTSKPNIIEPNKPVTLRYKIKNDKGEVLKKYETVHEKIMHFITVRKDLSYFQHLHPEFNEKTGEFTVVVTFPEDGPYRLFPDFTPGDENPMKLPVTVSEDIEVGDKSTYMTKTVEPDQQQIRTYGDYKVTTTIPQNVKSQEEVTYSLNISRNGTPVSNLESYLGALGHSVILKEGSLDFIHTHALEGGSEGHDMNNMQNETTGATGPEIKFATVFPESGIYKIFTQFQHLGKVQTVEYVVKVD